MLVATETFTSDIQQDLLNTSKYSRLFWDDFDDEDDVGDTNMTFVNLGYSFTSGQSITSVSLTDNDPEMGGYLITECYFHVDYDDTGNGLLRVSADGGLNWEPAENDSVHYFQHPGSSLRLRFVGGGSGIIRSWTVLYRPDGSSYIQELANATGEGISIVDELPDWDDKWIGKIVYVILDDEYYAGKAIEWEKIVTESLEPPLTPV
jgi:hypothetical protein